MTRNWQRGESVAATLLCSRYGTPDPDNVPVGSPLRSDVEDHVRRYGADSHPWALRLMQWLWAADRARRQAEWDADPTRPWGRSPRARAERIKKWRRILAARASL